MRHWFLASLLMFATSSFAKHYNDLEFYLYELQTLSQSLAEELLEKDDIDSAFHQKAAQLKRYTCRLHESFLRGITLKNLRAQYERVHFHLNLLEQSCHESGFQHYIDYHAYMADLSDDIDVEIRRLEEVSQEPPQVQTYWRCESRGYRFGSPYKFFGKAFVREEAYSRALYACRHNRKKMRRCAVLKCFTVTTAPNSQFD